MNSSLTLALILMVICMIGIVVLVAEVIQGLAKLNKQLTGMIMYRIQSSPYDVTWQKMVLERLNRIDHDHQQIKTRLADEERQDQRNRRQARVEVPSPESQRLYEKAKAEVDRDDYEPRFKSNREAVEYFRNLAEEDVDPYADEVPNDETIAAMKETEEYVKSDAFKNRVFTNEEAFAYLDNLIEELKRERDKEEDGTS